MSRMNGKTRKFSSVIVATAFLVGATVGTAPGGGERTFIFGSLGWPVQ